MIDVMPLLYALMGFMLLAAIVAAEARDLLSTVISVAAGGAGLAIVFLLLGAPDLAITQVVVEIVTLVLLIRMTLRRDDTTLASPRDMFSVAMGLIFVGILVVASAYAFSWMVPFGEPLMTMSQGYLDKAFSMTGAANAVTAVLLDFRAYDTLGEATVIFAAVIAAYAVLRQVGRKRNVAAARNEPHR